MYLMGFRPITVAVALAVLVVAGTACGGGAWRPGGAAPDAGAGRAANAAAGANATVTRVVDGDTLAVRTGKSNDKVRLIGIDTPESVKPNTPVQCFALAASARMKALLPAGTPVRLVRHADARGRYGRLLAYVYRASDGLFVNLSLVRDGYAVVDTIPPNVSHAKEFVAAAADARNGNRGLWAACGDDIPRHPSAPLASPP